MGCDSNGVDRTVQHVLSQFPKGELESVWADTKGQAPKPASMCSNVIHSKILASDPECDVQHGGFPNSP